MNAVSSRQYIRLGTSLAEKGKLHFISLMMVTRVVGKIYSVHSVRIMNLFGLAYAHSEEAC